MLQMSTLEKSQYAYIAGLMDGDGYISLLEKNTVLCITNTNYECLAKIKEWLNIGNIYTCKAKKPQHNDCYYLKFKITEIKELILNLYPYLFIKKEKAGRVLNRYNIIKPTTPQDFSDNEKFAYIAGMTDAEGCFSYGNKYSDYTRLSISNTNLQCLIKMKKWLNFGYITTEKRSHLKCKDMNNLVFSANKCRQLIPSLLPFLLIKKNNAVNLLSYLEEHKRVVIAKRPNRANYYKQRYSIPEIRTKKLQQIKEYKERRMI